MKERDLSFDQIFTGIEKFGWYGSKALKKDLPALRDYHQNVALAVNKELVDSYTMLIILDADVETEEDFGNAQLIGCAIQNSMERVTNLAELGGNLITAISKLEASATPGEAS